VLRVEGRLVMSYETPLEFIAYQSFYGFSFGVLWHYLWLYVGMSVHFSRDALNQA